MLPMCVLCRWLSIPQAWDAGEYSSVFSSCSYPTPCCAAAERAWLESDQILSVHREMMEGLMARPGLLRESAVGSTVPGGGR